MKYDQYTKAAIIGFWRMGATTKEINGITNIHPKSINSIIYWYKFWLD